MLASRLRRERGECFGMVRIPARQCEPVIDNVSDGPEHAPLAEAPRHVVIGTEDVEIARLETLDHEIDRLFGGCKMSGYGLESSRQHVEEYLNVKAVWINAA